MKAKDTATGMKTRGMTGKAMDMGAGGGMGGGYMEEGGHHDHEKYTRMGCGAAPSEKARDD
jgi:hypothetical protein